MALVAATVASACAHRASRALAPASHPLAAERPSVVPDALYEAKLAERDADTMSSCETQKLRDVPIGQVEACLRSTFLDGPDRVCGAGPTADCEGLLDCLPGVVWRR
jgi:hypothetical protein